jgi:hypothetical protein
VTTILHNVLLIDLQFAVQPLNLILGMKVATLDLLNLRQQVVIIIIDS